MTIEPVALIHHEFDPTEGILTVIADGCVDVQAHLGGASPDDYTKQCRIIGTVQFATQVESCYVSRESARALMELVTDWEQLDD